MSVPSKFEVKRLSKCAIGVVWLACAVGAWGDPLWPEVLATDLKHPWGLAFLSKDKFLVTERRGALRLIHASSGTSSFVRGVPDVVAVGQGGLLDLILDSAFAVNRTLYICYSEGGDGGLSGTALAAARLSDDETHLQDFKVLFTQRPKVSGQAHFGCRIAEGKAQGKSDGTLFLGLGDRFSESASAQRLDTHIGKLVRINKDGSVPSSNPFLKQPQALPEIFTIGHRNIQGISVDSAGKVWSLEHGPQGGDEFNNPLPGKNYGWPVITHGQRYGGGQIGEGQSKKGMEQPVVQWTPSIAPSGLAWLESDRYGKDWQGSAFVGSLKFKYLLRLKITDGKVSEQQPLLKDLNQRIRDVRQGPDGLLYVLTDSNEGKLIRLNAVR